MAINLQDLANYSPEELKALLEAAKKTLKTQAKSEDSEKEAKARIELEPYENALREAEEKFAAYKAQLAEKVKAAKEEYKTKVAEWQEKLDKVRGQLNKKRTELGLKTSRRMTVGSMISWHVEVDAVNRKAVVGEKEKPDTYITVDIDERGRVDQKILKEQLFIKNNIQDESGGRLRGLLNRIKVQYLTAVGEKNPPAEGTKAEGEPEVEAAEANTEVPQTEG